MSEPINPLVVDLSHWDPADSYEDVKASGIVGVIYKATEGQSYTDPTYVEQQQAAKSSGLLFGAYHFADGSSVDGQVANFMSYACPDPDELFVLDWEDNPNGSKMSVSQAKDWITQVETELDRPGECVIYGGNTLKEMIDHPDEFFASRRLWLCQYGSSPTLPDSWDHYWLWQYTDGVYGPSPHSVDGVGPCDINSFDGAIEELVATWAPSAIIKPPRPIVEVSINVPDGVGVSVYVNGSSIDPQRVKLPKVRDLFRRLKRVRESRHSKEAL